MEKHKPRRIIGPWNLPDLGKIEGNGLKVFSCFHCGGGSTMGYKLAGFEVLGGVEIDPEMMAVYCANHKPKHSYLMGVQDFVKIPKEELPSELFQLDILDGSPPCSSFSMAGSREKKWGGEHHFREGQAAQHLDDLFFDFIAVAEKLKPKVVIAENVKGLIQGNAKGYIKQIFAGFRAAGYTTQLFLLNAAAMGVPQRRERTVFVAVRNDVGRKVRFEFNEKQITLGIALNSCGKPGRHKNITEATRKLWKMCRQGDTLSSVHKEGHRWNWSRESMAAPCRTFASTSSNKILHPEEPRPFTDEEKGRIQTFPADYVYKNSEAGYICGMSVPPLMMQRIALEVGRQIFDVEYDKQIVDNFKKQVSL